MPKSARRVTFTRTVQFTYTADFANYAGSTDADALAAANLPGGVNSIGELLARSLAANGAVNVISNWAVSGTGTLVEPIGLFVPNFAYAVGTRVAPSSNPLNRIFVVRTAGTSGSSEPTWNNTIGQTVVSGGVTFMAVDKFQAVLARANSTAYTAGQIIRPAAASMKEYLVVTAGRTDSSASSALTASVGSNVTIGTATFRRVI